MKDLPNGLDHQGFQHGSYEPSWTQRWSIREGVHRLATERKEEQHHRHDMVTMLTAIRTERLIAFRIGVKCQTQTN